MVAFFRSPGDCHFLELFFWFASIWIVSFWILFFRNFALYRRDFSRFLEVFRILIFSPVGIWFGFLSSVYSNLAPLRKIKINWILSVTLEHVPISDYHFFFSGQFSNVFATVRSFLVTPIEVVFPIRLF